MKPDKTPPKVLEARAALYASFILGLLIMAYLNTSAPRVSAALLFLGCVVSSARYTASGSLTLEQVPSLRGSVMSLSSIALSLGATIGTSLGGLLLLSYGYGGLGVMGLFSVGAAILYRLMVVDPRHDNFMFGPGRLSEL